MEITNYEHNETRNVQIHPAPGQTFWSKPIGVNDVKKLDIVRFKRSSGAD